MADAAQRWESTVGTTGADQVQEAARDTAEDLKDTVRESSTQLSSTARDWMQQEADQRTSAIASQARSIADAMRQTTSKLHDEGQPQAARVTEVIADRVDQAATYLDQADGQRLMSDAQDVARRNPWAVAAAGLVAGFAASRFMKASRSTEPPSGLDASTAYETRPAYSGSETSGYGGPGASGTTGVGTTGTLPAAPGTTGGYGTTGPYGEPRSTES